MLETERLVLRPWRSSEASLLRELWAERDPRVPAHRRLSEDGHPTVEELEERIRSQPRLLAVELKATREVIGYCGLVGDAELAYEFFSRHWGRGYATEAACSVIAWARESGHDRLTAGVRDWNVASRAVLAKLGFVGTGVVEPDAVHGDSVQLLLHLH